MSKRYLIDNTSFIEVGSWKGGVSGLVSLANKDKNVDYFVCDTFSGVVNSSEEDFFKNLNTTTQPLVMFKKLKI